MANATDDSSIRYSEEGGVKLMQLKLRALNIRTNVILQNFFRDMRS